MSNILGSVQEKAVIFCGNFAGVCVIIQAYEVFSGMIAEKGSICFMDSAGVQKTARSKWIILIIVVMTTFMNCLDSSVVNVALPVMTASLKVTSSDIQWVVTSYLIVISATILVFGRLGDILGKTRVFKFGIILFTAGSLLCGTTHSLPVLLLARVIQAVGAAGTMANSQGIITEVFPAGERGRALGLNGTFVALGSLVGPPLGGFIVDSTSWEFIFLINVPIGILTFLFGIRLLPKEEKTGEKAGKEKADALGALLFIAAIVSFFLAVGRGQEVGFANLYVLLSFLVSGLSFAGFVAAEIYQRSPLLDLAIFRNKLFSLSIFCGFISFVAIFCTTIIQPFYLQDVMGFSPSVTGLIMMTYPLLLSVVAPASGYMSDKIGSEIITLFGLALTSIGLFCMSLLNESSSILSMVLFIALMSIGNGLFQSPNNSLVMSTVPRDKLGVAGSVNALVRNLGMICGIALATVILYARMSRELGYRVSNFVPGCGDAFISGMSAAYKTAGAVCLVGALLTAYRLYKGRKNASDPS